MPALPEIPSGKEHWLESENWFNYADFYSSAAQENFKTYVEVGAWKGHSTRHLANELLKTGKEFCLYAVDLWDMLPESNELYQRHKEQIPYLYTIYDTNLKNAGVRGHVFDLKNWSHLAAGMFKDQTVDFVFIDAGHDKDSAALDMRSWLPKIKEGGIMAGHDSHAEGVNAALKEVFNGKPIMKHPNHEVWMFVNKIKKD